jgi:iron(III) transport system substrate-binding protein
MKAFLKLITLMVLFSLVVSCGGTPATTVAVPTTPPVAGPTQPPPAPTEVPLTANEQWAKANSLGVYDTGTQDWAAIEAAAKQEGKVVIYSNSSRIADAATAFMALYPEITVEPDDMGGAEVVVKVREEQKAGAYAGDVWLNAQGPDMIGEFLPNQWLWKFIPSDLLSVISEEGQNPVVTASTEVFGWVYNSELNTSCPINNWWQLTDAAWKGKIFIKDPINSAEDLGMLMSFAMHTDEVAAAYKALYGTEWNTDAAFAADTPDAGYLWIKKFTQNKPIGEPGSDDVWKAMATPGMTDNMLGWLPLSKYRNVTSGKAVFTPCVGLSPVIGLQKHNYLAVINQAPHPNAAKLFIKFALSAEGFAPWNQVGQFSARTDVQPIPAAVEFKSLPVWNFDNTYVYNNIVAFRDFYAVSLLTNP